MHKVISHQEQEESLLSRLPLSQQAALICGGLCLLTSLALVSLGILSSRFIVNQQQQLHGNKLAQQMAEQIAPILAGGDRIRLEVSLQQLQSKHQLLALKVIDVEGRALGAAGAATPGTGVRYRSPILLEGNIAGECLLVKSAEAGAGDLRGMSLGLLSLSLLLSIFVAVLAARWGQNLAQRLRAAITQLVLVETGAENPTSRSELQQLENTISRLPLDLLKPTAAATTNTADYRHANLLYIKLTSLAAHVETLDESSLLHYTALQRRLIGGAAELYGGKLTVVRPFGLLVSFGEGHNSGDPAFRALAAAWLIKQVSATLNTELPLRMKFSLACGFTETGVGSSRDIYPDLYNQHLIDELEAVTSVDSDNIMLMDAVAEDLQVSNRCRLSHEGGHHSLTDFAEPYHDLLQRQQELLLRELRRD
jgi:hypothetical protein